MPREHSRGSRVADLVQRELAMLIQRDLKDPRLGMVTVHEVRVSRDLAFADVYFTVLAGEESDRAGQVEAVLNQASGFLRSRLARLLDTRTTPWLRFHYDNSIEQGARLEQAIDSALARDKMMNGQGSQFEEARQE